MKFLKVTFLWLLALLLVSPANAEVQSKNEQVVVLHGLARSSSHMASLARYLEEAGYTVFNLNYPSTEQPLSNLAAKIAADLRERMDPSKPIHFVGYSLGGIVTRVVLNKYRPDNLGRVVQLASPNGGSEVADFLKENWLYGEVFGPAGQQLVTEGAGISELMGEVTYELGVIAGNFTIDPVSSAIIPGDDDGKVSIESTKVAGMRDHIIVPVSHTFFPQNDLVQRQTRNFLQFGAFIRN